MKRILAAFLCLFSAFVLASPIARAGEAPYPELARAFQTGDYDRSLELVQANLALDPEEPFWHGFAADIYERIGGADEAVKHLRKAVALLGDGISNFPWNVHYRLGRLLFVMGLPEEALPELRQALLHPNAKVDPHNILGMLAQSMEMTGRLDEALERYEGLLTAKPQDAFARNALERLQALPPEARRALTRAWALYREGKHDLAWQEVSSIVSANPSVDHARGLIALAQGRTQEAVSYLRTALWAMPGHPSLYRDLRNALFLVQFGPQAFWEPLVVVRDGFKQQPFACPQDLTARLNNALDKYFWLPEAYKLLAICASKTGDRELASRYAAIYGGMANAVFLSGPDGRNWDSAIRVLNVREEYLFLEKQEFQPTGERRTLVQRGNKRYDVLTAASKKSGITRDFYFDVSHLRYD